MPVPSIGNPDYIKYINVSRVFQIVLEQQPISRVAIARQMDISKVTVSSCVDYLLSHGLLKEIGSSTVKKGRPPIQLVCNKEYGILIGIETDVLTNRLIAADFEGNILEDVSMFEELLAPHDFICAISQEISRIREKYAPRKILGVGLALSGYYNPETHVVDYIANRKDWLGFELGNEFKKYNPELPFFIQRLSTAGAMGEATFGDLASTSGLTSYFHCSWGIGVGIYQKNNHIQRILVPSSRFGHTTINYRGKTCPCGRQGCLEAYASINALLEEFFPGQAPGMKHVLELQSRFQDGEADIIRYMDQWMSYIVVGLANLVNAYQPETIIIGGLINRFLTPERLEGIRAEIDSLVPATFRKRLKIVPSSLQDQAICLGSVAYVRNHIISMVME